MNKSNIYIIGVCVILIFISIGILIYILNRKKNGGGGGGYTQENINVQDHICEAPYSSSMNVEKYVRNICDLDPDCKGYYGSDNSHNNGWFIATDKDPGECSDKHTSSIFTNYFKKPSYAKTTNTSGNYGCQLKASNIADSASGSVGATYVKKLCDLDSNCVGYYSSTDNLTNIATQLDLNADISGCPTDLLYDGDITQITLFNRKSKA